MSDKTTINIKKSTAERLGRHGRELDKGVGQMADFCLNIVMIYVRNNGLDALLDLKKRKTK